MSLLSVSHILLYSSSIIILIVGIRDELEGNWRGIGGELEMNWR
jgi:hypothetical protein